MKALLVSSPLMGHLNPLLGIGRMLIAEGHEVVGLSSSFLRDRIEGVGATFRAFPQAADIDTREIHKLHPEIATMTPGPEMLHFILDRAFVQPMLAQYEGIKQLLRAFPADIIIGDHLMLGVFPLLLGPRSSRPPVILLGTTYLLMHRDDGAPNDAGIPPAENEAQRKEYAVLSSRYEASVFGPVGRHLNDELARIGVKPLAMNLYDAVVTLPDAYLQLTVPSFELPRRDLPASVHFVGPLPIIPNQAPLPPWANELDDARKVVLVTQGTLTNNDFGELVLPTLAALADDPDVLVIVTTGGRSVDGLPGWVPANARVAQYLPFEWVLPRVDAFVTNGGYGSVNQALSFGVPLVMAGTIADRGDVGVRVAWAGVGVNLATNAPAPPAIRRAVRAVLDGPHYRSRAAALAAEYRSLDTRSEILRIIDGTVSNHLASDRPALLHVPGFPGASWR
jgi:MGT family glycosyltransferase